VQQGAIEVVALHKLLPADLRQQRAIFTRLIGSA
jgi:hypothetical protein